MLSKIISWFKKHSFTIEQKLWLQVFDRTEDDKRMTEKRLIAEFEGRRR